SWSTGESTQTIYATATGDYAATVGDSVAVSNNYSLEFDGVDYVSIASTPTYDNMDDFTLLFWVKVQGGANRQEIISKDVDPQPSGDWSCYIEDNFFTFEIRNGSNPTLFASTITTINNSTWYSISVTRNMSSGMITIYVNGQFDVSFTGTTTTVSNTNNIHFAKHAVLNTLNFEGELDQISIWNIALSQSEIQSYMTCPPIGAETGLLGYWNFEEGTGTTTADQTSNGNDGTLNGGTAWSINAPGQTCVFCTATDTVYVSLLDAEIEQDNTTICVGDSVTLSVDNRPFWFVYHC
ncbi:MAG TPA: hypothetical protein EYN51_01065, partial [Flavobacteriales bacterium]|nr:hypothetical protein [Flavobacteriales bacterium]